MMNAQVLIAGERFGVIRDAFLARGIPAISCDMAEAVRGGPHIVGDWREVISAKLWSLIIIHPTCTKVTVSSNGTYAANKARYPERVSSALEIAETWRFVKKNSKRAALENPVGVLPTLTDMGKPAGRNGFTIQPYNFGADASKRTCFWTHELPPLKSTKYIEPRYVNGRPRWANQTDSGQNRLAPTADPTVRQMARAETYPGVAAALADQWGRLLSAPVQSDILQFI